MKKNKTIIIIIALAVLLLIIFSGILFINRKTLPTIDSDQKQEKELTEEEKSIQHFLSLKGGIVFSVADDYFIMEMIVIPEDFNPEDFNPEEENNLEKTKVKVRITDETEFVDSNDMQFVEIPEEYQEGLAPFNYIKNIIDEEYIISVYIDLEEDIDQQGMVEGQEITATYISWSCFPEDFMQ